MSNRYSQIVILCEDRQHEVFIRHYLAPKKIRFFGKIGFLTVHQRPEKSDFLEKSDF
jgi:citrate lyase synthetase